MATKNKKTNNAPISDESIIEALTTQMNIKDAARVLGRSYNWLLKKSHDLVRAGLIESRDAYPVYHRTGGPAGKTITVYFNSAVWPQDRYYIRGSFDEWQSDPGFALVSSSSDNAYYSVAITLPQGVEGADFFINNGQDLNDPANLYQPTPGANFHLSADDGSDFTIENFDNAHPGKPEN